MKRIFFAACVSAMMLLGTNAFAEWNAGGGFVQTRFGGADNYFKTDIPGFYFGLSYDFAFSPLEGLTFEPGLYYMHFGKKISYEIGGVVFAEQSYKANYLSLPLHLKYSYEFGPVFKLTAYTGPRFNFGFWGSAFKKKDGGMGISNFDAQWGVGVAGTFARAIRLGFGYDFGMNKVLKENPEAKVRRNMLYVNLSFLF